MTARFYVRGHVRGPGAAANHGRPRPRIGPFQTKEEALTYLNEHRAAYAGDGPRRYSGWVEEIAETEASFAAELGAKPTPSRID